MRRLLILVALGAAVVRPSASFAQDVKLTPPADFAAAAAACIDAVSPDKLDPGKLNTRSWDKQSEQRAPFGSSALYTHAGSAAQIFASPSAEGFCIVDGYAKDFGQFETYRDAIASRLKADYNNTGLTAVAIGKAGDDDRRQGFAIGNAVAGYSGTMRNGGLNLRFTVVNAKFAGSVQAFQTSRPPLSESEIGENRAKDRAAADFAGQPGTAQDLVAMTKDCATALRGDGALPGNGWRKGIHASGSPRAMEALKRRDTNGMLAGMAQTRQQLYFVGRHGYVTKYYVRGVTTVCEATIYADSAALDAIETEAKTTLTVGGDSKASGKAAEFASEYQLSDLQRTYRWNGSEVAVRKGSGTSFDAPNSGKFSLSIFVF